jgi:hypothetical protein
VTSPTTEAELVGMNSYALKVLQLLFGEQIGVNLLTALHVTANLLWLLLVI